MKSEQKMKHVRTTEKEKKVISSRTAVKGLITGFIAYGILLSFIFLTVIVVITWYVENNVSDINNSALRYTLPSIGAILVFFVVKITCRLSTFDLFKKCKIEEKNIDKICGKMNFFYICVVVFSVLTIILYLITRFSNERIQINRDMMMYSQSESTYAIEKEETLNYQYELSKSNTLIETMIVEMGLLLGVFSLIPNQKKLIEKYN